MDRYSHALKVESYGLFVVARTQCAPVDIYDLFGAERELMLLNAGGDSSLIPKRKVHLGYFIVDSYLKRGV
jgi:ApbE superfamily uncharacterized protein (UPF0280 family)